METKSILSGITEHDVVTVHNPLSTKFDVKVARSVVAPAQRQIVQTGNGNADAFQQGLQQAITQGGHQSMAHVQQTITFQPGQTMRLPGDVARLAVRQIVKEMMQREKQRKLMSNMDMVVEYEKRVVLNHESMLSNMSVESAEERLQRQIADLNKTDQVTQEATADETAFPTETPGNTGTSPASTRARRTATQPTE